MADMLHVCLVPVCKCYQIDESKKMMWSWAVGFLELRLIYSSLASEKKWTFRRLGGWDERVYVPVETSMWQSLYEGSTASSCRAAAVQFREKMGQMIEAEAAEICRVLIE